MGSSVVWHGQRFRIPTIALDNRKETVHINGVLATRLSGVGGVRFKLTDPNYKYIVKVDGWSESSGDQCTREAQIWGAARGTMRHRLVPILCAGPNWCCQPYLRFTHKKRVPKVVMRGMIPRLAFRFHLEDLHGVHRQGGRYRRTWVLHDYGC